MTWRFVIDTNHVSLAIRGERQLRARFLKHRRGELCLTAISLAELEFSTLRHPQPQAWDAAWRRLIAGWPVLSFTREEAAEHARIRAELRSHPIGERDLFIAAIARANAVTVVTHNLAEFRRVKGLRVEDWAR